MVRQKLRRGVGADLFTKGVEVLADSPVVWNSLLGVHMRRRGARDRDGPVFKAARFCGRAGLRNDGNRVADQPESSLQRSGGIGRQNSARTRIQAGGRR